MKIYRYLALFSLILFMVACKQKKAVVANAPNQMPPPIGIWEAPVKAPDSIHLRFQIMETTLFSDSLVFNLRYGGGCIKPHVFQCYTSGMKDGSGIADLFLSHHTLDDHCKALVFTRRTYSWAGIFHPGDQIRINGGPVMTIPNKTKQP
jgi:hypothetical protein